MCQSKVVLSVGRREYTGDTQGPALGSAPKERDKPTCRGTLFGLCTSVSGHHNICTLHHVRSASPLASNTSWSSCLPVLQYSKWVCMPATGHSTDSSSVELRSQKDTQKTQRRKEQATRTGTNLLLQGPEEVYFLVKPRKLCGRELPGRG